MYIEWRKGIPYDKNGEELQFFSDKKINEMHRHLDTEEEYERDSIAAEFAEFHLFMEDCVSVYATTNDHEKYLSDYAKSRKLFLKKSNIMRGLAEGIEEQELDKELLPQIPIVEYKLVPTGNIIYYDPNMSEDDRHRLAYDEGLAFRKENREKRKKKNIWQDFKEWLEKNPDEGEK